MVQQGDIFCEKVGRLAPETAAAALSQFSQQYRAVPRPYHLSWAACH